VEHAGDPRPGGRAEAVGVAGEVEAIVQAQREDRRIGLRIGGGVGDPPEPPFDPIEVSGERGGLMRADAGKVRMCARADPEPLGIPPVGEVVPAFLARLRPVRDLVVAIPGGGEPFADELVQIGDGVLARLASRGLAAPAGQPGPASRPVRDRILWGELQLERIGRQVVDAQGTVVLALTRPAKLMKSPPSPITTASRSSRLASSP